jgi:hypothetical protein
MAWGQWVEIVGRSNPHGGGSQSLGGDDLKLLGGAARMVLLGEELVRIT